MPLSLSDDELSAVLAACQPLAPDMRNAFLQEMATALAGVPVLGPGAVHGVIVATQRRFFEPPADTGRGPLQLKKIGRR